MTDATYTHFVIIADGSGSMGEPSEPGRTKAQDSTAGIHAFIRDQAALPGKATFTLTEFRWNPDTLHSNVKTVASFASGDDQRLLDWRCMPYGGTPLLDAVGQLITETGAALTAMPESQRPGRVICLIATDGKENQSKEYTKPGINAMITHQREVYKWDFVFLGVQDADSFKEAGSIGVPMAAVLHAAPQATADAYLATASAVSRARAGGQSVSYNLKEREMVNQEEEEESDEAN